MGDTRSLPIQTQQFVQKLSSAKLKIDKTLENIQKQDPKNQRQYTVIMFDRYAPPLCDIIIILLNDTQFNETFPILRESFKEIYHLMIKY